MAQIIDVPGMGMVEFPDDMSDADIVSAIKKNSMTKRDIPSSAASDTVKDLPEYLRRAGSYASEAIAGAGDMFLNAPNRMYNLGKAGVGTAMTAAGRPDLAPQLTPDPDLARKAFERAGFIDPSVTPENEQEKLAKGIVQAGTVGMMAPAKGIPQMAGNVGAAIISELAGQGTEKVTDSPTAAMAARMLTVPAVAGASNTLKAGAQKVKDLNAPRDNALKEGRKLGLVAPRSETGGSFLSNRLEGWAGKAALKQAASLKNQQAANDVVRKELGIPENSPISVKVLNDLRNRASWPYKEIKAISKRADAVLNKLQDARQDATDYWREYNRSGSRDALKNARNADSNSQMLERSLEKIASSAGRKELVTELRKSRQFIAKTHDVERALNVASGDVELNILGRMLDRGKPLSGGLKTLAEFQQNFPKFTQPGASAPAPGISKLGEWGTLIGGGGGYAIGGPVGAVAGAALPLLSGPIRNRLLSSGYQNAINPTYPLASLPTQENAALRSLFLTGVLDQGQ